MALSDADKDLLRVPVVTAAFLEAVSKAAGLESLHAAAQTLQLVPVEQIAEALGVLRTDEVFIETGTMEILDDIEIELFGDEDDE